MAAMCSTKWGSGQFKSKSTEYEKMVNPKDGKLELLTDKNSTLLLVDYQPAMFAGVASGDKTIIKNAAYCAAKAASILNVPVVLSTIGPQRNGEFIADITKLFPGQEVFARTILSFDAFEDEKTWNAFKKTGRKKMVVSGLWTSMCFAYTALHGLREGYEVYGLMDAGGDSTPDAHKYGIKRMLDAGVIPITVESLVSEWMHDWGNPKSMELVKEVYSRYGAMIGLGMQ
jgi:nicotinamidase-related amidase